MKKQRQNWELLLPSTVFVAEAEAEDWEAPLTTDEHCAIANAVASRTREFAAGRSCSRRALVLAGHEACSIGIGEGRAPVFPVGYSGSITHTRSYCAAAVVRIGEIASIGIDAEIDEPMEAGVVGLIALPEERKMLTELGDGAIENWSKLLFSIKESFYKAYFQVAHSYLDFLDVLVVIQVQERSYKLTPLRAAASIQGKQFCGSYAFVDGHILTTAVLWRDQLGGTS